MFKYISHIIPPLISLLFCEGFLTYAVSEEVMHIDFSPFLADWVNHIPLNTILVSAVAFYTSVIIGNTEGTKGVNLCLRM